MQLSQTSRPTCFVVGVLFGIVITLLYSNLSATTPPPATAETPTCPACPVPQPCPELPQQPSHAQQPVERQLNTTDRDAATCPCLPVSENRSPRATSSILETPDGTHLGLVQPIYELRPDGKMKLPDGIKRIALDVGTSLYSPSSAAWLEKHPKELLVLGFEPNIFSHSLVAYTSHPIMALHPKRWLLFSVECKMYNGERIGPTFVNWYTNCMNVSYGHLVRHRRHYFPANAAVSNRDTFARFNLGVGDPGVGSLYDFKPGTEWTRADKQAENWGHSFVPTVRLESVLKYIPDDIVFEQLKVDAQGHDAEVIAGVGEFLPRFKCIIGEFDTSAYAGANAKGFDYQKILGKAGFVPLPDGVWINRRFAADFRAGNYVCSAYDVNPKHQEILRRL